MDLTGKQVLVAGLGKSGIAAGALLKKMGCMVCLFDGNEKFDRSAWKKHILYFRIVRCGLENCRMRQYRRWNLQW